MLSPENRGVGHLTTIIDWYQNLPKRAREGMSLANLHDLSKSLDAARAESRSELLKELRAEGWSVAAHNDYRLGGVFHTFWLLTHPSGRWIKGEGKSDIEALTQARSAIASAEGLPSRLEKYDLQTHGDGFCADPQAVQPTRGVADESGAP